jgi:hypothetical protein
MPFLTIVFEWIHGVWVDLFAVLAGLGSWFHVSRSRRKCGLPNLTKEQQRSVVFGGATIAMLATLGLATFIEPLLKLMLSQERVLLFFVLLHAIVDEFGDMSLKTRKPNSASEEEIV